MEKKGLRVSQRNIPLNSQNTPLLRDKKSPTNNNLRASRHTGNSSDLDIVNEGIASAGIKRELSLTSIGQHANITPTQGANMLKVIESESSEQKTNSKETSNENSQLPEIHKVKA
jgi:hypothetical protein